MDIVVFFVVSPAESALEKTTIPRMPSTTAPEEAIPRAVFPPTLRSGPLSRASVNTPRDCHGGGGGGGGGERRRFGPPPGSALSFLNWSLVPVTVASGKRTVRREEETVRTISPSSPGAGAGPGRARPAEPGEGRGRERLARPACPRRWMTVR